MIVFKDTETGPQTVTTSNQQKSETKNEKLVLEKPRFNCDVPDRYFELLNFQLEVTND